MLTKIIKMHQKKLKIKKLKSLKIAKAKLRHAQRKCAKAQLRKKIQDIEKLRSKDSKEYWKKLYELEQIESHESSLPTSIKNSTGVLVSGTQASEAWKESFSKLGLESTDLKDFDSDFYTKIKTLVEDHKSMNTDFNTTLDQPFTLEEVKIAISNLKRGKAVGIDGIMNEVFKYGGENVAYYVWKLFDFLFTDEQFPMEWSRGIIVPIFKGGPPEFKCDPNKYRGITLLSIVGKTYTGVLNRRLNNWIEDNDILADEQAGFRRERSTTDQIFILTEIIIARRPKKTFVAFIDIAKAYDRVWRDGLWYKLTQSGIKGKLWRILKNIYKRVESAVNLGQDITDFFTIDVGLRQGCLLSPILFDLFLNDLVKELNALGKGVKCGNKKVTILLFADDIALIANSKEDLEFLLEFTFEFSKKWRFKFNYDKCAVIEFDNKDHEPFVYGNCTDICTCGHHYRFGKNLIMQVVMYKYLGVELDNRLSYKYLKRRLATKARTNVGRIWALAVDSYL
jgi:hypothetical protein